MIIVPTQVIVVKVEKLHRDRNEIFWRKVLAKGSRKVAPSLCEMFLQANLGAG
jgi:hypothetical protein